MKTIPVLAALAAVLLISPLPAGEEIAVEGTLSTEACGMLPPVFVPIVTADSDGRRYAFDLNGDGSIDLSDAVACLNMIRECRHRVSVRGISGFFDCDPIEGIRMQAILDAEVAVLPGDFACGDVDGSGRVNITDAVFLLGFLFLPQGIGLPCPGTADANGDGTTDISDPVLILMFLFGGGRAPSCG